MPSRGAQQQIQRRRTEQGDDLWELLNRLLCVHQNGKSLTGKIEGLPCRSNAHSGIGSRNCHHAPRAISAPASQCILPTARGANVAFYRLPSLACNPKNGRCGDLQTLHGWRHSPLWRWGNVLNAENREPGVALSRLGWLLRRLEEATVVHRKTAGAYLPLGRDRDSAARELGRQVAVKDGQLEQVPNYFERGLAINDQSRPTVWSRFPRQMQRTESKSRLCSRFRRAQTCKARTKAVNHPESTGSSL
jgi:hypothetical protein